jgi:hypothetical protein
MRQALMTCVILAGAATSHSPGEQQDAVAFWTEARMRSATPLDTLVIAGKPKRDGDPNLPSGSGGGAPGSAPGTTTAGVPPTGSVPGRQAPIAATAEGFGYRKFFWGGNSRSLPASSIGRLFFKGANGKSLYSCSGAVVAATNGSLVWTAGRCLHDPELRGYSRSECSACVHACGERRTVHRPDRHPEGGDQAGRIVCREGNSERRVRQVPGDVYLHLLGELPGARFERNHDGRWPDAGERRLQGLRGDPHLHVERPALEGGAEGLGAA